MVAGAGVQDFGNGTYVMSDSNDPSLGLPAALPGSGGTIHQPPPPLDVKTLVTGPKNHRMLEIQYTTCTDYYKEVVPGVENPDDDIFLGETCVEFDMGNGNGINFDTGGIGGLGAGGSLYTPACSTTTKSTSGGKTEVQTTYGCSKTPHCKSDYYQDNQLAPDLLASYLIVGGYTVATAGTIASVLAGFGVVPGLAAWAAVTSGGSLVVTVENAMNNLTLHDALGIIGEANTLYQDELANGCASVKVTAG